MWIDGKHAAKLIGISRCTLRKLVKENEITHTKIGRSIRFRQEWINQFIERKTTEAKWVSESMNETATITSASLTEENDFVALSEQLIRKRQRNSLKKHSKNSKKGSKKRAS